jgi:hypothetical protein
MCVCVDCAYNATIVATFDKTRLTGRDQFLLKGAGDMCVECKIML